MLMFLLLKSGLLFFLATNNVVVVQENVHAPQSWIVGQVVQAIGNVDQTQSDPLRGFHFPSRKKLGTFILTVDK